MSCIACHKTLASEAEQEQGLCFFCFSIWFPQQAAEELLAPPEVEPDWFDLIKQGEL